MSEGAVEFPRIDVEGHTGMRHHRIIPHTSTRQPATILRKLQYTEDTRSRHTPKHGILAGT